MEENMLHIRVERATSKYNQQIAEIIICYHDNF